MNYMQMGILGSILAIQSFHDIRKKELPVLITIAGATVGVIFMLIKGEFYGEQLISMMPGIVCLVFAKISREAMGYGDGLLICMMGIYLNFDRIIAICMWAFILAGVVALFLLVFAGKKGKYEMPFVPFLFTAFILEVCIHGVS